MKHLHIYLSLLFFIGCLAGPSVVALNDLMVKETKVAKIFDMEEEDSRDTDSETEIPSDSLDKFFKGVIIHLDYSCLLFQQPIRYMIVDFSILDACREQPTPPPRG